MFLRDSTAPTTVIVFAERKRQTKTIFRNLKIFLILTKFVCFLVLCALLIRFVWQYALHSFLYSVLVPTTKVERVLYGGTKLLNLILRSI